MCLVFAELSDDELNTRVKSYCRVETQTICRSVNYVHDSTLFVTLSFKQIDHFHNLDKFKYSFIYRVSKKN